MKIKLATAAIAGCAALCLTLPAFGQDPIYDTIYFNGSYTAVALGYGAGYYGGTLQIGSGTPVPTDVFICDDFADHIFSNESWQVTAITFASLTTNNFSTKPPLFTTIGVNGYAAVAALAGDMAAPPAGVGQGDVSAALWYLTAGGVAATNSNPSNGPSWSSLSSASQNLVSQLQNLYGISPGDSTPTQTSSALTALSRDTSLWLYTPTGADIVNGDGNPQEFIAGTVPVPAITAPEGGEALSYLLLAGLVCFGAMLFKRNQVTA